MYVIALLMLLTRGEFRMDTVEYAEKFLGVKYSWGGKTPEQGFDCSGLVSEALKGCGLIPNNTLLKSKDLYTYLLKKVTNPVSQIKRGTILFFGSSISEISHIAIARDENFMVEAGGEGRAETDKGFVRIRPISNRSDLVGTINLL